MLGCAAVCGALPQRLTPNPVPSPDKSLQASIEWEDVGYIGLLRIIIYDAKGQITRKVEMPEISPEPISLVWVNNEWVGSESFVGEHGGGFFYVNATNGRGYLLEIVEPRPGTDWVFTVTSNSAISTATVSNISRGQSSLFPILLRDAPRSQTDYMNPAFVTRFAHAVDVYNEFRRVNKIHEIDLISDADIRPELGAIFLGSVDDVPQVIYFPAGAPVPEALLSKVQRQKLPDDMAAKLASPDAPDVAVRWLEGGEYVLEQKPAGEKANTSGTILLKSRFENVSDTPYVAPTVTPAVQIQPAKPTAAPGKAPAKSDDQEQAESSAKQEEELKSKSSKKATPTTASKKTPTPSPKSAKSTPTPKKQSAGDLKTRR